MSRQRPSLNSRGTRFDETIKHSSLSPNYKEYEFFDSNNRYAHDYFTGKVKEKKAKQIKVVNRQLFEIARDYITGEVTKTFFVPPFLKSNSERWTQLFLNEKRVQSVFLEFHARLEQLLKIEFQQNKEQLQMYLNLPHSEGKYGITKEQLSEDVAKKDQSKNDNMRQQPTEEQVFKSLKYKLGRDKEAQAQFDDIMANDKLDFHQKVEQLKMLSQYLKQKVQQLKYVNGLKGSINEMNELTDKFQFNNDDLGLDLEQYQTTTDYEKLMTQGNETGEQLQEVLQALKKDNIQHFWSSDELDTYKSALWKTTEQFENELKSEERAQTMIIDRLKQKNAAKIAELREKTSIYIDSLETALIELRITKDREIESLNMQINDIESSQINSFVKGDDLDDFLLGIFSTKIASIEEGKEKIMKAVGYIKKLKSALEQCRRECNQEIMSRMYSEKMKLQAMAATIKYHELTDILVQQFVYICKKLEIHKDMKEILHTENLVALPRLAEFLPLDKLDALRLHIEKINISKDVDFLYQDKIARKENAKVVAKFLNEIMNSLDDAEEAHTIRFDSELRHKLKEVYDTIPHEIHQEIIKEEEESGSPKKKRSSSHGSLNSLEGTTNNLSKKNAKGNALKELEKFDQKEIHSNDIQVLKTFLIKDEDVGKIMNTIERNLGKTLPELVDALNKYISDLGSKMGGNKDLEALNDNMFSIDLMPVQMLMQGGRTEQAYRVIRDAVICGQSFYLKDKMKDEILQQQNEAKVKEEKGLQFQQIQQQKPLVVDFNAIKTEIQKQSKFFTNAKQEMFNEVLSKMNSSKDLPQFIEKIATHPKPPPPQIITQVVEKIVHVPAKEGTNKLSSKQENNQTESGDIKRDQKQKRINNDKKPQKPLPKHPSPELNRSLDEPSRMNIDINNVSRHNNSKLSGANNPFNGPLSSQEMTLEANNLIQMDNKMLDADKPTLQHPDFLSSVEVNNTGQSTELGTNAAATMQSPIAVAIPFQFGNAGITIMKRRQNFLEDPQYSTHQYRGNANDAKKHPQKVMFEASCNTNIKMGDLDFLMNVKNQAHTTIATLEKAYDNSQIQYFNPRGTSPGSIQRHSKQFKAIKISDKPMNLLTPRDRSPDQIFELRADQIDKIKNKRNFPERSIDKFMPNLAKNINYSNRLHTGWDSSRDKNIMGTLPQKYQLHSGLKDALHFTDLKILSPDVIIDSKLGQSPQSTSLTNKLRQTREKGLRFQLGQAGVEPSTKMNTPMFNNRILRMFDPSYLTMTGDSDSFQNTSQMDQKSNTFQGTYQLNATTMPTNSSTIINN